MSKLFPKQFDCTQARVTSNNVSLLKTLNIQINNDVHDLLLHPLEEEDESYTINILDNAEEIQLEANHYSGVVRGLDTLAQLIKLSEEQPSLYHVQHLPLQIQDSPRYPYRGLMLDTSRRFYSVASIKQILDSMAAAKFNVLHWHLVDDDSFPMELQSFPNVTRDAAFSADRVYTTAQMVDIVSYASQLAIRIIPEFDNPGHSRSIGLDPYFNEIIRCFNKDWPNTVPGAYKINGGPPTGVLDPSNQKTYDLIRGIFTDFNSIFPDNYIHLGGDEVFTSCFGENPNI